MAFTDELIHPLPNIKNLIFLTQDYFQEWMRRHIIDDDPYDLDVNSPLGGNLVELDSHSSKL